MIKAWGMNIKEILQTEEKVKEIFIITRDVIEECLYESIEQIEF